ncbi:MAG: hypothetical protein ACRD15_05665 [Vicinamibacterales bacterium]
MTVGTKSVLFGAHCFFLHPWFVAWAWWKLYGFPRDPRLWIAFVVHDIGYLGRPNMDGQEGEEHPRLGARIMAALFDGYRWKDAGWERHRSTEWVKKGLEIEIKTELESVALGRWGLLCLLHSRYYAKTLRMQPSRLCIADKLAISLTPAWLYLPMVRATGEIHEYMAHAKHRIRGNENVSEDEKRRLISGSQAAWYSGVQDYCRRWAFEHRDGKVDTWTSSARQRATVNEHGVWQ